MDKTLSKFIDLRFGKKTEALPNAELVEAARIAITVSLKVKEG